MAHLCLPAVARLNGWLRIRVCGGMGWTPLPLLGLVLFGLVWGSVLVFYVFLVFVWGRVCY